MSFFSKIFSELFKSSKSENKNVSVSTQIKSSGRGKRGRITKHEQVGNHLVISRTIEMKSSGYGKSGRITKHEQVRNHLIEHGTITSWEAIQKYGATRLSGIIFRLRKSGLLIDSVVCSEMDRNGNNTNFVTYTIYN